MRGNRTDHAGIASRENEIRRLAKKAGFIARKSGIVWSLIQPEHDLLRSDQVIDICRARIRARQAQG
jgi:hypothetical protein